MAHFGCQFFFCVYLAVQDLFGNCPPLPLSKYMGTRMREKRNKRVHYNANKQFFAQVFHKFSKLFKNHKVTVWDLWKSSDDFRKSETILESVWNLIFIYAYLWKASGDRRQSRD